MHLTLDTVYPCVYEGGWINVNPLGQCNQRGFLVRQLTRTLSGFFGRDKHFFSADFRENLPIILGLLGVWNSTFLGHSSRALLPYSQALVRFPAHIQQVHGHKKSKEEHCKLLYACSFLQCLVSPMEHHCCRLISGRPNC